MAVRPEFILAASDSSPFYGARRTMAQLLSRAGGGAFQTEQLPPGWLVRCWGGWEGWTPRDWVPRIQGWKIHVSTTPACAVETLARTTRICVARGVAFKFLPDMGNLVDSNGKQQDRGSSGKFITIYPRDDEQLHELLDELETALAGQQGPYILSDLRYREAPVYVRYGGIMPLSFADPHDRPISAISSGEPMALVKDRREPRFVVPEGVELPDFLVASYERSRTSTPSRLRDFSGIAPLHFSNAGGVYKATLADGGAVRVLREARSHTGLDARGRDAVARQLQEEEVLRDLVGIEGVQQLQGSFWAWEHRYLELDYAEGRSLTSWVVQNTPFAGRAEDRAAYAERCTSIADQVVAIVERIHEAGWAIGDLHPGNILVSDDDRVTVIDFEDATRIGAEREIGFRVFEFCAPEELTAEQADWYAIARSLMLMYVPEWELEVISPSYWQQALAKVEAQYGARAAQQIVEVERRHPHVTKHMLAPETVVTPWQGPRTTDELVEALDAGIAWSRQFSAQDSYPGDPAQAGDVSESFSFGRAGIVWARHQLDRPQLDADLTALEAAATTEGMDPGLLAGQAGIAMVLAEVGRHEAATRAIRAALVESSGRRRLDLYGGRAGVVLAAIEVARLAHDDDLLTEALAANEHLQRTAAPDGPAWEEITQRRGLHFGPTGLALVDLVGHIASGRPELLQRAIARLRDEVDNCITTGDGDLMVRDVDNNRALPYIEWGSAGVWGVLQMAERLAGRPLVTPTEYRGFLRACSSDVYVYATLDHGRAGIMTVLACAGDDHAAEVRRQRELTLTGLLGRDGDGVAMALVVGDGLVRLSADLSTGAAGLAVALHAVEHGNPFGWLPTSGATAHFVSQLGRPAPADADQVLEFVAAAPGKGDVQEHSPLQLVAL